MVADVMKTRKEAALQELAKLIKDKDAVPINYNHYYTDNVHKKRAERIEAQIKKYVPEDRLASPPARYKRGSHQDEAQTSTKDELEWAISKWRDTFSADMEEFSCEESLDCLDAIYKVRSYQQPTRFCRSPQAKMFEQTGSTEGFHSQRHDPGH